MTGGRRSTAWMICPTLGATSETWMMRQVRGMTHFSLRVITGHDAPIRETVAGALTEDSAGGLDVRFDPWLDPDRLVKREPVRQCAQGLSNWRFGFFRGRRQECQWLTDQVRADRPAVVLCQYGPTALRYAPLLDALRIPTVVHFHGYDLSRLARSWSYRARLRALRGRLAGWVVVADYMVDLLRRLGIPADRIRKIPYGVPLAELPVSRAVGRPDCQFLAVGRFVEKKRPDLTIRAFARCLDHQPSCQLIMIGDGPLLESCRGLARDLGVQHAVDFRGAQPFDAVRRAMREASVFVQHSVTAPNGDREGWPVAIAEALGSGLPVVATRHASIPEQIEDLRTGLLVDEGDWQAMAQAMTLLAIEPERRGAMGEAARRQMARFDLAGQLDELQGFLAACAPDCSIGLARAA